jgi:hypothetical protein
MVRGRVTTVLDARRTTQQEILQYATTGKANEYTG